jgi:hypothetical protein
MQSRKKMVWRKAAETVSQKDDNAAASEKQLSETDRKYSIFI